MSIWSISIVTFVNSFLLLVRFIIEFGFLRQTQWGRAVVVLLILLWEIIPILTVLLIFGRIASVKTPTKTFSKEPELLAPKSDFSVTKSFIEKFPKDEKTGLDTDDVSVTYVQSPSNGSLASEGSYLGKTYYDPQGLMFKNSKYSKDQKM